MVGGMGTAVPAAAPLPGGGQPCSGEAAPPLHRASPPGKGHPRPDGAAPRWCGGESSHGLCIPVLVSLQ